MFVYFDDIIIGMKQIIKKLTKKRLIIKTKFDADNPEHVKLYNKAVKQLNEDGVETETGTQTILTEYGLKIYLRFSLTSDFILWIILPLIALITLIF